MSLEKGFIIFVRILKEIALLYIFDKFNRKVGLEILLFHEQSTEIYRTIIFILMLCFMFQSESYFITILLYAISQLN